MGQDTAPTSPPPLLPPADGADGANQAPQSAGSPRGSGPSFASGGAFAAGSPCAVVARQRSDLDPPYALGIAHPGATVDLHNPSSRAVVVRAAALIDGSSAGIHLEAQREGNTVWFADGSFQFIPRPGRLTAESFTRGVIPPGGTLRLRFSFVPRGEFEKLELIYIVPPAPFTEYLWVATREEKEERWRRSTAEGLGAAFARGEAVHIRWDLAGTPHRCLLRDWLHTPSNATESPAHQSPPAPVPVLDALSADVANPSATPPPPALRPSPPLVATVPPWGAPSPGLATGLAPTLPLAAVETAMGQPGALWGYDPYWIPGLGAWLFIHGQGRNAFLVRPRGEAKPNKGGVGDPAFVPMPGAAATKTLPPWEQVALPLLPTRRAASLLAALPRVSVVVDESLAQGELQPVAYQVTLTPPFDPQPTDLSPGAWLVLLNRLKERGLSLDTAECAPQGREAREYIVAGARIDPFCARLGRMPKVEHPGVPSPAPPPPTPDPNVPAPPQPGPSMPEVPTLPASGE